MYDYMKALQKRFDRQSHPELDTQVKSAQEELRRDMDAAGRRKLLRLLDAQNTLLVESKLMSFTAGFKLAWGMAKRAGGRWALLLRAGGRRTHLPSGRTGGLNGEITCKWRRQHSQTRRRVPEPKICEEKAFEILILPLL